MKMKKKKKTYTKVQSANHHPFSVLVTPAPYNMNHQILLTALFATRNEGVKQGNQCTDAFLFISSKTVSIFLFRREK